jgi:hypothetical protein
VGVIAAMVLLNRPPAPDAHSSDQAPEQQEHATDLATSPLAIETAAAPKRPKKSAMVNRATNRAPESMKSAAIASPAGIGDIPEDEESVAMRVASDVTRVSQAIDSLSAAESEPPPVTITGCLEISTTGDEFRLTDTDGTDVPKSRGWRTAFLKKRAAPVTLVNALGGQALKSNVGKRVAATGLLASRELTVNTPLRVVDASCD